jgi:hypothetical protein
MWQVSCIPTVFTVVFGVSETGAAAITHAALDLNGPSVWNVLLSHIVCHAAKEKKQDVDNGFSASP